MGVVIGYMTLLQKLIMLVCSMNEGLHQDKHTIHLELSLF